MDSHRCSSSGSSSYSSSSVVAADEEEEGWRGGADRMVKIELEAAEALADLAHLAMRKTGFESGGKWGSKGKRAMKRVKSESPATDCRLNTVDSAPRSSDHSEDQAVVDQKQCENLCNNVVVKPIKAEQEAELLRPSPLCSTSYSLFGGGRSRQNLTEAEKEARRLRRILANRESARQTIRRRQALCEELTRKAADLAWENENLRREKELALKEYQSLETTNRNLKARVAKAIKAEVEETQGELKSGHGDVPTSPTNCPMLLYNRHPFTPLFWPAVVQSSNSAQSQHGPQNFISIPSNGLIPATNKPELSNKQDNLMSINGSRSPLYLLPCPWFFPLPDHGSGLQPQPFFGMNDKQDENTVSNQNSASASSKNVANLEINNPALCMKVKTEDPGSIEARPINDLNETVDGYPQNGGGHHNRAYSRETIFVPAPGGSVRPAFADKYADGLQSDCTANVEAISSTASQIVSSLPEKNQEQDMYPSKKLVDAVAAAEARRRRKELTKLKNLHGRQCRMQYC